MKQVLRKGLKEIVVDEVPEPVVSPHHVLIRPVCSLISSGTETASIHQAGVIREVADNPSHLRKVWDVARATAPVPTVREVMAKFSEYAALGYAGAGILADRHATVTDLEPGDRVAYGGEGTGHAETIITGRNLAVRVPDAVPLEHACFATLGSIAMNAVRVAGIGLGERVAVLGLGLVGQLVAQMARLQGAVVIAADLKQERTALAVQLGARHGLTAGDGLRESILEATRGVGADCVVVAAAAKSAAPCRQALEICRDRGRIVVVGAVEMAFPWQEMYLKEIQLLMARAYGPGSYDAAYEKSGRDYPLPYVRWTENRNMEDVLRLMEQGDLDVGRLITHRFALEQAPEAYRTILDPAGGSLAVLLEYPNAAGTAKPRDPVYQVEIPGPRKASGELRFALVGAGNIARWAHMPALKATPGTVLRAVYSNSGVRAKSYGLRYRAAYCCSRYEDILRDPEIDVVLITTRNQHHAGQALAALEAGKHVFVEKPMALTEDECGELSAAVSASGKAFTVGFNRRFAPFYVEMQRQAARRSGPAVVNCRVNSPGISGSYWMADPAIGGAILGEACHFIDLLYWLLGSEPVAVSAFSLPTGRRDPIGENNLAATFRFADGSVANLTYCTVGSKTSGGERVELFAPGVGLLTEDFKSLSICKGMRRTSSKWWAAKGYGEQLGSFVEAIRQGRAPEVTVEDGTRATVGCLRMLDAARSLEPRQIAVLRS
jgi:predicted dehydrogenase/threonine dehydrogenase-like Zn-dependent dehydrogenase